MGKPAALLHGRENGGFAFRLQCVEGNMIKAISFGVILTGSIALIVGSQGASAGPLMIEAIEIGSYRLYWSWPIFAAGSALSWFLILLQK